jgi:hypothetical protein
VRGSVQRGPGLEGENESFTFRDTLQLDARVVKCRRNDATTRDRIMALLLLAVLAGCGGGGDDNSGVAPATAPAPVAVPVDGVGVFLGTYGYRFAPENAGYAGGGYLISDGSGMALFGARSSLSGMVLDYRFSRSANSTSGDLFMRRYQFAVRCSGTGTGTLADNVFFNLDNWVLTNDGTGQECRGGYSGNYQAARSEYPATSLANLAGNYSSSASPYGASGDVGFESVGGGFSAGGTRFTVEIGSDGTFTLDSYCLGPGTITLVDVGKGIARISGLVPNTSANCGVSQSSNPLDGLVAFDGSSLLVIVVQPGTSFFYYGALQKQ